MLRFFRRDKRIEIDTTVFTHDVLMYFAVALDDIISMANPTPEQIKTILDKFIDMARKNGSNYRASAHDISACMINMIKIIQETDAGKNCPCGCCDQSLELKTKKIVGLIDDKANKNQITIR